MWYVPTSPFRLLAFLIGYLFVFSFVISFAPVFVLTVFPSSSINISDIRPHYKWIHEATKTRALLAWHAIIMHCETGLTEMWFMTMIFYGNWCFYVHHYWTDGTVKEMLDSGEIVLQPGGCFYFSYTKFHQAETSEEVDSDEQELEHTTHSTSSTSSSSQRLSSSPADEDHVKQKLMLNNITISWSSHLILLLPVRFSFLSFI